MPPLIVFIGVGNLHIAAKTPERKSRTLRAIYNKAVRRFNATDTLPFRDVYTGIDKTRSRAIDEKQVARLAGLKLGGNKNLEVARDLFIFSYATRGMSFVDMAYLKKSNVKGNYITYSRKKSGARMEVKIEPPVAKIIRKYGGGGSEYLLPILQELKSLDEQSDSSFRSREYRRYQSGLSAYNRTLKLEEGHKEGLEEGHKEGLKEGMEKGLAQGLEEGMSKGLAKGQREVARKMKAEGLASELISSCTGLTIDEIEVL